MKPPHRRPAIEKLSKRSESQFILFTCQKERKEIPGWWQWRPLCVCVQYKSKDCTGEDVRQGRDWGKEKRFSGLSNWRAVYLAAINAIDHLVKWQPLTMLKCTCANLSPHFPHTGSLKKNPNL